MEKLELIEVGDEVGCILPDSILEHLNAKDGDVLEAIVEDGKILVKKNPDK